MGRMHTGQAPEALQATSIGSCIALCLYDKSSKIGGMAHIMLPAMPKTSRYSLTTNEHVDTDKEETGKYADTAIDELIAHLSTKHVLKTRLEAKIAGGSEMFASLRKRTRSIGDQNIEAVKLKLESLGIPIVSEDIGGNVGRSVIFYLESGDIEVKKRM